MKLIEKEAKRVFKLYEKHIEEKTPSKQSKLAFKKAQEEEEPPSTPQPKRKQKGANTKEAEDEEEETQGEEDEDEAVEELEGLEEAAAEEDARVEEVEEAAAEEGEEEQGEEGEDDFEHIEIMPHAEPTAMEEAKEARLVAIQLCEESLVDYGPVLQLVAAERTIHQIAYAVNEKVRADMEAQIAACEGRLSDFGSKLLLLQNAGVQALGARQVMRS
jgi:cobalamin biosynthesis protein CobT